MEREADPVTWNGTETIDELITVLQDARDELGGGARVRVVTQRVYPLSHRVVAAATANEGESPSEEGETGPGWDHGKQTLWLACDTPDVPESPYAPRWVWGKDRY
jgi:hypothetical protein